MSILYNVYPSVHGLIAGLDRELGYWDLTTDSEIRHFPAIAGRSGIMNRVLYNESFFYVKFIKYF